MGEQLLSVDCSTSCDAQSQPLVAPSVSATHDASHSKVIIADGAVRQNLNYDDIDLNAELAAVAAEAEEIEEQLAEATAAELDATAEVEASGAVPQFSKTAEWKNLAATVTGGAKVTGTE